MIENIKDVVKNFRERLASPFFFSFIVTWLLFNWKVTVALLWYNAELFSRKNSDLISFIESKTSNWQSIWIPLISATLYTGLIRNLISAFITWSSRWGSNWNLEIGKNSKVSMEKFLTYRNLYIKTTRDLEIILKDESKTRENFDKERQRVLSLETFSAGLNTQVADLMKQNEILEREKNTAQEVANTLRENTELIENMKGVSFLNGRWKFQYLNRMRDDLRFDEIFEIKDGIVSIVTDNRIRNEFRIANYFYERTNKQMLLILYYVEEASGSSFNRWENSNIDIYQLNTNRDKIAHARSNYKTTLIHQLEVRSDTLLTGFENVEAQIVYEKIM